MSAPEILTGLSEIADRYDLILCDVWGVVHNGKAPFPRAVEALERFGSRGGRVVLVSNSPRPRDGFIAQLDDIGVSRRAWTYIATSGDATLAELRKRAPGPAWAVGPDRDLLLYDGAGVILTDNPADAAFVSCTGLIDDETEQPEDYRARFQVAVDRGLEMVCANPDKVVHRGSDLIWCAGALADVYEAMGGKVVMAGKPYRPIYDLALRLAGDGVDPARILCIGDGLPTDVLGANNQNIDCYFVAGGIHGADVVGDSGRLDPTLAERLLADHGAQARFVSQELSW